MATTHICDHVWGGIHPCNRRGSTPDEPKHMCVLPEHDDDTHTCWCGEWRVAS